MAVFRVKGDGGTIARVSTAKRTVFRVTGSPRGPVGPKGPAPVKNVDYFDGVDGTDGRDIELQSNGTFVQWRYLGDETWIDLVDISTLAGADGADGTNGTNGTDGEDGREVQLQASATHIQWRYSGDPTWVDLVALSLLKGDDGADGTNGTDGTDGSDGREVQFNKSATHIQWRYVGDATWIDLVALADITGDDGTDGTDGTNGADGTDGNTILSGSGAPAGGTGNNGDFYIDTANSNIYGPKSGGAWGSPTSLVGPGGSGSGDMVASTYDPTGVNSDAFAMDNMVESATKKVMTSTERTKLSGVESGAQVNTVASVAGKTGAVSLVKADVGLSNVDNTADTAKPVSTAQQTALNAKENLAKLTPIAVAVTTAAATAAKVGTTTGGTYTPATGDIIVVTFTLANTATSPTINIDGSGAKNILLGNTNPTAVGMAGTKAMMWYDGTAFQLFGSQRVSDTDTNTTYLGATAFTTVTGTTQAAAANAGYIANHASTGINFTLPATAAIGQIVHVLGLGAGGWRVTAPSGDNILIDGNNTGAAGYITGPAGSTIGLRCIVANTTWEVIDYTGNLTTGAGYSTAKQPLDSDLTALAAAGNSTILAATTASFLTADETKLDGIEAGADVTDTANVTAAGALMDSELSDLSAVKTLQAPDNTTISTFGASLIDDAAASNARTTLGIGNVDNTSDANKPVSTATQTELDTKAERIDMRTIERFTYGSGGFSVTLTNAIQGIAFDGTHYYVTTKSHLYKYNTSGTLVTSRANSGDANTHKYLGDLVVVGGVLFVASANFDGSPGTFNTYVVRFNASDLTYISETQISTTDRCDSITYHDGEFWCPMYGKTIRRFDSSWNLVAEYTMPIDNWEVDPSANGIGFDGATWVDNYFVLNPHEGIYPDCGYVLYFNGTTFERIAQIDRPTYCTQGIDYVPSTGQVVAAERIGSASRVTLMNIRTEIPARSEWKELRRTTLAAASDTITVQNLPNRRYLKMVCSITTTGGSANAAFRFNNDSGTKYSRMRSVQMAAGSSALSQTSIGVGATNDDAQLIIGEVMNVVGTSKIGYFTASQTVDNSGATAPSNITVTGKYADTSSYIERVDVLNTTGTGDFAAGSELIVYGRD